jgi:PilZ domain-containing protein
MVVEPKSVGAKESRSPVSADPKAPATNASLSGTERRREHRYPCNDPVEVRILPDGGQRVPATLLDVSKSGLRLQIGTALLKGAEIEILLPKQIAIFGKVRHCRRMGESYQAGILIQEAFYSAKPTDHIAAEQLASYLTGHGLTLTQVIRVRDHLTLCSACRLRMVETYSLKPQPRKNGR